MKKLLYVIGGLGVLLLTAFIVLVVLSDRAEAERLWGFVDASGTEVIEITFDDARGFANGMAAVKVGQRWGFVDADGRIAVPAEFEQVGDFTQLGLAWAQADGSVGYLRSDGSWSIAPRFGVATAFADSVAVAGMVVGRTTTRVSGSVGTPIYSFGIVDRDGTWIVEPREREDSSRWGSAERFSGGLAAIKIDDAYGYVNRSGVIVISPEYQWAQPFADSIALARHLDGAFHLLRSDGSIALELGVSDVIRGEDGFLSLYGTLGDDQGWFLADVEGSIYAGPYDEMGAYAEGRLPVTVDDAWFLIDVDGNRYGAGWDSMGDISEGMVPVATSQPGIFSDYAWGYMDTDGNLVIEPHYNRAHAFRDGLALVAMKRE